ncbi:hypothetical protein [Niabella drilacis]|uniref:Uncharacterized protein n=1 Tax=Niabella drilacis (strain DSM 25811 / CCM 8410 / CCUG 62505 / LMG 26954 / E90) TaxID=1285928 RepID=A0A1G6S1R0_NIADE|nr:hypothetical protein [Niabella drilacis]SDD10107.1 hypothetical protein SAMN04487894_10626 [Niabella drilacis]
MRPGLTILLLVFLYHAYGQKQLPAVVANTYTLTEADGFPGFNYTHTFEYQASGKIYATDFFGNLHITGNNFIKSLPGFTNITNETVLQIRPGNELWIYEDPMKIFIIKNDTLWKVVEHKDKLIPVYDYPRSDRLFALKTTETSLVLYEFKEYQWLAIGDTPLPPLFHSQTRT